jgi:hypothetical protein
MSDRITQISLPGAPDVVKAQRFDSAHDAMQSPAFTHWASDYEPQELQPAGGDKC